MEKVLISGCRKAMDNVCIGCSRVPQNTIIPDGKITDGGHLKLLGM